MKKSFICFLFFCFLLYSCKNNESSPEDVATPTQDKITPTQEIMSNEKIVLDLTETPVPTEETLTAETTCVLCGRITKCTALIDKVWNSDLAMAVDKAYYLCDNCYPLAETNKKDNDTYSEILMALDLYFSSEDVLSNSEIRKAFYTTKKEADGNIYMYYEPGVITIDSNGVHFKFVNAKGEEKIKLGLNQYLGQGYYTNYKTDGNEYEIQVVFNSKTREYEIENTSAPKNILGKLG